ncbi:MAG: ChaB family protein [Rickettsiaceae bacterium]|nr:ChaB family protein [Rickettsiaceae bacterium]
MPYKTNEDLPDSVKDHLPKHAQDIYREAFNHAHEEYQDKSKRRDPNESLEEISHKVAWSTVKKKYHKTDSGDWEENGSN